MNFKINNQYHPKGDQNQAISKICKGIEDNYRYQTLHGITGSGKTFTMASIIEKTQRPAIIISHNKTLCAQLYKEFKEFLPNNSIQCFMSYYDYYQPESYIPHKDLYIEKDSKINDEIEYLRLSTTYSMLSRKDVVVISTVSSIYGIGSPNEYSNLKITINKNTTFNLKEILKYLIHMQYINNTKTPLDKGEFRIIGDILQIFPPYFQQIIQIDFFGQEIENIFILNSLTLEKINTLNSISIYPAKHFISSKNSIQKGIQKIEKELQEQKIQFKQENKLIEVNRIHNRTIHDIETIRETGYCKGIENYSRHFEDRPKGSPPFTLLDYFDIPFILFIDESHITLNQIRAMYEGNYSRKENLVKYGFRLPSAFDNRPLNFSEFENKVKQFIFVSATPGDYEIKKSDQIVIQTQRPTGLLDPTIEIKPTQNQIMEILFEIKKRIKHNERTIILTSTKKMSEDLSSFLNENNIYSNYIHSEIETIERSEIITNLRKGIIHCLIGINLLREGIDIPEASLLIILDADKIGFLRSHRSLIQMIGRVARNTNGHVIMHADKITEAMNQAITETYKRRTMQIEFNKKHKIIPKSIKKPIEDILIRQLSKKKAKYKEILFDINAFKKKFDLRKDKDKSKYLTELHKKMFMYSEKLEFETALKIRDEIKQVKN